MIEGKVYDITSHVEWHPTLPSVLASWCGTEATRGIAHQGLRQRPQPGCLELLDDYLIGTLAE